jgi:hypothetical protein
MEWLLLMSGGYNIKTNGLFVWLNTLCDCKLVYPEKYPLIESMTKTIESDQKRFKLGVSLTIIWVLATVALLMYRFQDAAALKLNEWGDVFAGFFAPIAFLWLVFGYRQQGEELKTNTEAVLAQRDEQARSVKIAAYTALMEQEVREMDLFNSLGTDY